MSPGEEEEAWTTVLLAGAHGIDYDAEGKGIRPMTYQQAKNAANWIMNALDNGDLDEAG